MMIDKTYTTFQKHTTYKDSGMEWLGVIPEHWEAIKMKPTLDKNHRKTTDNKEVQLQTDITY